MRVPMLDQTPEQTNPEAPLQPVAPSAPAVGKAGGSILWVVIALSTLLIFNLFFTPGFFHIRVQDGRLYGSLIDVLNRAAPVMLLALGMTLVIATKGVDLSVGAVIAIAGSVGALLINGGGLVLGPWHLSPLFLAVAVPLLVAALAGAWNGTLVGVFGIQPIVATLILMVSGRGIAKLLTNAQIITFENPSYAYIGGGHLAGLPFTVTIVLVVALVAWVLLRGTALGLFVESVGGNERASYYAGVNARAIKVFVYAFCGFCAGVAGLIICTDIKAADANNAGMYLELDAILAVVIGGTSINGGRFSLIGSLIGALLIQSVTTTILSRGVAVELTLVFKAIVVIAVCLLQSPRFRSMFARRSVR